MTAIHDIDPPLAISSITEGELLYGLARKPEATRLRAAVESLLVKTLSTMDRLIAAHAIASDAILVTSGKAFSQVEALRPVANWATDV